MKYGIAILGGAADFPIAELGGRTPLQAARTPAMDAVAQLGRLGTVRTTPDMQIAGSDMSAMCLLGYDPAVYYTGRAPLEAASFNVPMTVRDWAFRADLVSVGEEGTDTDGQMLDPSAAALTEAEATALTADLTAHWRSREPELMVALAVHRGGSNRNILIDSSGRAYNGVTTVPPHVLPRRPWDLCLPEGEGHAKASADVLCRLMELSAEFLPSHPVNAARKATGQHAANMCWIWGQGTRPAMPSFASRFGVNGAMATPEPSLSGIAALIGWARLNARPAAGASQADHASQGRAACEALDRFDVVCCHMDTPNQAALRGDWRAKVAAIEALDTHVAAPMLQKLKLLGEAGKERVADGWRMLILPDHATPCSSRKPDATAVPFAMAGSYVRAHRTGSFDEAHAGAADLHIRDGHELMEFFLSGGRAAARGRIRGAR